MDYIETNRSFWNNGSKEKGPWSKRCPKELIEKARQGEVENFITTEKLVPKDWLPSEWNGLNVLGLAAGGGQQMPIIAATGANVTSFDLSCEQLQRDTEFCTEEGLKITTQQGDMSNLRCFANDAFDYIINPVSNCFVANVTPVWNEVARVLRPGGVLISGFNNPVCYALDQDVYDQEGKMVLKHSIPYSDTQSLSQRQLSLREENKEPFEFGHSLSDLIGGQTAAGLKIVGFYEDFWGKKFDELIDTILPQFIATRAQK